MDIRDVGALTRAPDVTEDARRLWRVSWRICPSVIERGRTRATGQMCYAITTDEYASMIVVTVEEELHTYKYKK